MAGQKPLACPHCKNGKWETPVVRQRWAAEVRKQDLRPIDTPGGMRWIANYSEAWQEHIAMETVMDLLAEDLGKDLFPKWEREPEIRRAVAGIEAALRLVTEAFEGKPRLPEMNFLPPLLRPFPPVDGLMPEARRLVKSGTLPHPWLALALLSGFQRHVMSRWTKTALIPPDSLRQALRVAEKGRATAPEEVRRDAQFWYWRTLYGGAQQAARALTKDLARDHRLREWLKAKHDIRDFEPDDYEQNRTAEALVNAGVRNTARLLDSLSTIPFPQ